MKIEFVIDELVLHGFDARHRHAIADVVEAELSRLARVHARELTDRQPMDVPRMDAGSFQVPARTPAAHAGVGIASTVLAAVRGVAS